MESWFRSILETFYYKNKTSPNIGPSTETRAPKTYLPNLYQLPYIKGVTYSNGAPDRGSGNILYQLWCSGKSHFSSLVSALGPSQLFMYCKNARFYLLNFKGKENYEFQKKGHLFAINLCFYCDCDSKQIFKPKIAAKYCAANSPDSSTYKVYKFTSNL